MRKNVWIVVILLVLAAVGIFFVFRGSYGNGGSDKSSVDSTSGSSVSINNFAFSPETIKIKQGGSLTWTNNDNAPHTVTSDSGNELSSSTLDKGMSYSHTFAQKGTFAYHCSFHSGMKGTVIVE